MAVNYNASLVVGTVLSLSLSSQLQTGLNLMTTRVYTVLCAITVALFALFGESSHAAPQERPERARHQVQLPPQLEFRAPQYVDGAHAGLVGDGRTDNTQAFQRLLGQGNRTIRIAPGDYVTGKLTIPKNTILLLAPGVIIRDSGKLGPSDRLINIVAGNVYIRARGAKLLSDRRTYGGGEQRHGVFIYGASNVVIDGLQSDDNSGDGFYIGGPPDRPAENITLDNCVASGNRRQGLSIASARNVQVIDSLFENTRGTPPAYGIDLEPNNAHDWLDNIRIVRARTQANDGGGILIVGTALKSSPDRVNVDIVNHISVGERHPYQTVSADRLAKRMQYTGTR